jgi:hypothetical protein
VASMMAEYRAGWMSGGAALVMASGTALIAYAMNVM